MTEPWLKKLLVPGSVSFDPVFQDSIRLQQAFSFSEAFQTMVLCASQHPRGLQVIPDPSVPWYRIPVRGFNQRLKKEIRFAWNYKIQEESVRRVVNKTRALGPSTYTLAGALEHGWPIP